MTKFLVLFLAPASVLEAWAKTDPETRRPAEEEMRGAWAAWKNAHAGAIGEMGAGGRTRRVATDGVGDTKNDILVYTFVEAESHEAATRIFEGHPHLQIPQASIEVMAVRPMTGL